MKRLLIVAIAALLAAPSAALSQTRVPALQTDLDSLVRTLQRTHPALYRRVSRGDFEREAAHLRAALPALSDERAVAGMMHLVARVHDGHTTLLPSALGGFDRWIPVRFYRFSDGVYITAADSSRPDLPGKRVRRIGRLSAERALDSVASLMGADNRVMRQETGALLLSSPAALHALGIIADSTIVPLLVDGITNPVDLRSEAGTPSLDWRFWGEMFGPIMSKDDRYGSRYRTAIGGKQPLDYRVPDDRLPYHLRYRLYYYFTPLPDPGWLYVQCNFTQDDPREPFPDFRRRLWAFVDSAHIDHLILDIRYNSGGNGALNLPFVHDIIRHEKIDRAGHLYVLLGRKTFSAAVMLAAELARQTPAVFVGEAPGAGPNHSGDATAVPLPSGMTLEVATLFWQLGHPADSLAYLPVSYGAPFSAAQYYSLADPAVSAVLDGSARPLISVLREDGVAVARAAYEERRRTFSGWAWWQPFDQFQMNSFGYEMIGQHRYDIGVAAFELNSLEHPDNWGWWDSLGDGYLAAGQRDLAVSAFRRAIALNPRADETRGKLEELGPAR